MAKKLKRVEIPAMDPIERGAEYLVQLANEAGEKVVAEFNDIDIVAYPGDNPQRILNYYFSRTGGSRPLDPKKTD